MNQFVIKHSYLNLFFLGLIFLEFALPHVVGLKSTYLFLGIIFIILLRKMVFNFKITYLNKQAYLLFLIFSLYCVFCFFSVFWSVSKPRTIMHGFLLIMTLFCSFSAIRYDSEVSINVLQKIVFYCIVLSWLALLISPQFALQEKGIWRLRGIFFHEFELGFVSAIAVIILCIRWCTSQVVTFYGSYLVFYFLFSLSLITLLATQTRTLLGYTFIVCLIALLFFAKGNKRLVTIGIFFVGVVGSILLQDSLTSAFSRGESDATLSGRTIIWERALAKAEQSPILGFGFASFTNPKFDADFTGYFGLYRPPHAHNTWVMSYFETGIIGSSLLTLFLVFQLFYGILLARIDRKPPYGLFLGILATLVGFTSLIYGGQLAALSFLPLILLLQRSRELGWNVKTKSGLNK